MNTPTTDKHAFHRINGMASPDGDVVGVEVARKLERERDEARQYMFLHDFRPIKSVKAEMKGLLNSLMENTELKAELTQLRNELLSCNNDRDNLHAELYAKESAELAKLRNVCDEAIQELTLSGVFPKQLLASYSTLPHVMQKKGTQ